MCGEWSVLFHIKSKNKKETAEKNKEITSLDVTKMYNIESETAENVLHYETS